MRPAIATRLLPATVLLLLAAAASPAPAPSSGAQWVPRGSAELTALNKIDAQATPLRVAVGRTAQYGSLTIAVKSCQVRPPDMVPDATAWLDITDSRPGAPGFHGWMLRDEPNLSSFEHPVYDVRLAGCS